MRTRKCPNPKSTVKWMLELYTACYSDVARASDIPSEDWKFDLELVKSRLAKEGPSFFTKSLPLLGKNLDRVLSSLGTSPCFNGLPFQGWALKHMTVYPRFLGWLFAKVLAIDGSVSREADPNALGRLRQLLFLFYKVEFPSTDEQNRAVLDQFVLTDQSLPDVGESIFSQGEWDSTSAQRRVWILKRSRKLIHEILSVHDPLDIERNFPRHGPGAVATGERSHEKPLFKRYHAKLHTVFPYDSYMSYSLSSVADEWQGWQDLELRRESTAKVVLVPKDSRGPRIISCEPLEIQWIQQALMKRLVDILESHPLTRGHVNFQRQDVNRELALLYSVGAPNAIQAVQMAVKYGASTKVTMDMKDASDRVSLELVRYMMPQKWFIALDACRSEATKLPDGQIVKLKKFAPMGSAVCFPVEALIFYAICVATQQYVTKDSSRRKYALKEYPYVYGDDLIVESHLFELIVDSLECVHLKVNMDKCCLGPWFRESCGMDAFNGVDVTPLKIRRPWGSPSHTALFSWCEYHNWFSRRGYEDAARLIRLYLIGLPDSKYLPVMDDIWLGGQSPGYAYLHVAGERPHSLKGPLVTRFNRDLHRKEFLAWGVTSRLKKRQVPGWSEMLSKASRRGSHLRGPVKGPDKLPSVFERTLAAKAYEYALAHGVVRKCAWYPLIGG
jgi:hypothetical protein